MRILVVGAGSTGGYFGACLARHDRDVTFLVRARRKEELLRTGLEIKSPHGDFAIQPKLVTAQDLSTPFDVVLLTVKAFALEGALADLAKAVGPDTMIVPVLNGMRHVDAIKARFGEKVLLGGVAKIASTLDASGRVLLLAPFHTLTYGEMDGSDSERVRALDKVMKGCGFDAELTMTIAREMWEKWMMLSSLGAITCLMRGTIGEVAATPGGAAFALSVVDEFARVISKVGLAPDAKWVEFVRGLLTTPGSTLTSSMYRDMQQGLQTEADQILGDLRERALAAKIESPMLNAAHSHLMVYQNRKQI